MPPAASGPEMSDAAPTQGVEPMGQGHVNRIAEAFEKLGLGWSLSFIGEDQASKLGTLTRDLTKAYSDQGDGKQIASGFSYWGIGPTVAWIMACKDRLYPVMNESTKHFATLWCQARKHIPCDRYHYVSLGVGTGEKDNCILRDLLRDHRGAYYFPVDMSQEMLRLGAREAIRDTSMARSATLPIQIDFSVEENVDELRGLLDSIVSGEPILFSLLGNTLSNFAADLELFETIARLLRPQDRLLLEIASTDALSVEAQRAAADEYDRSRMFKDFVTSSLFQNTDLPVDLDSVSFVGSVETERAILIKTIYRNQTGDRIVVTLPDRGKMSFAAGDTIRLSTMRKYTSTGIDSLVRDAGFESVVRLPLRFSGQKRFGFGSELLLLSPAPPMIKPPANGYQWDIFIAYSAKDKVVAEQFHTALKSGCRPFIDSKCLELGATFDRELPVAQRASMMTVVLVSKSTEEAFYQREEIAAAISLARRDKDAHRVVPVSLDGEITDTLPFGLGRLQGLSLRDGSIEEIAGKLIALVNQLRKTGRRLAD
jgi:uncharacterized SAM-dependent methyltransferase